MIISNDMIQNLEIPKIVNILLEERCYTFLEYYNIKIYDGTCGSEFITIDLKRNTIYIKGLKILNYLTLKELKKQFIKYVFNDFYEFDKMQIKKNNFIDVEIKFKKNKIEIEPVKIQFIKTKKICDDKFTLKINTSRKLNYNELEFLLNISRYDDNEYFPIKNVEIINELNEYSDVFTLTKNDKGDYDLSKQIEFEDFFNK